MIQLLHIRGSVQYRSIYKNRFSKIKYLFQSLKSIYEIDQIFPKYQNKHSLFLINNIR